MSILKVVGLTKEFGPLVAVNNVTFSAGKGQIIGLIGPNGAGKTTLIRMVVTRLTPTSGMVEIAGYDAVRDHVRIRRHIGYLPDFFNLYNDLTIEECLTFFAEAYGVSPSAIPGQVDAVLRDVSLEDKRTGLVRHLSRGMVQRMGLAVLMVHDPDVYLLDEPASGLDPQARKELRRILTRLSGKGKTVLISSHILTELSDVCTHVAIMDHGKILTFDEIDRLRRFHEETRTVRISVLNDVDRAIRIIQTFPDCRLVRQDQDSLKVEVVAAAGAAQLADINRRLVEHNIGVVSFGEERPSLEDVFIQNLVAPVPSKTGTEAGSHV
jgi:ABC-2 type transport system ATP-binding protein